MLSPGERFCGFYPSDCCSERSKPRYPPIFSPLDRLRTATLLQPMALSSVCIAPHRTSIWESIGLWQTPARAKC
jgi:hypothetical protein